MGSKLPIPSITLRYKGVFDLDGLYAAVTSWAKNYEFLWHERDYKHKVPVPAGAEQEMKWDLSRKVTDYISYSISMAVQIWDLKEIQVEENGKKKRLSNARIQININGVVISDWQKIFGKGKFAGKLGNWYEKVFIKSDLEGRYWDPLYYRIWNLHAILKKYLEMQGQKYAYKGYLGED